MDGFKEYKMKGVVPSLVGRDSSSGVWNVGNGKVAKLRHLEMRASILKRVVTREYEIQRVLYDLKISVPKPYGVYTIRIGDGDEKLSIVMDYVPGDLVMNFDPLSPLGAHARELRVAEVDKARAMGFATLDTTDRNAIYNPLTDHVTLIDFDWWRDRRGLS
jgi:hypothetical protein